jgi:hypothetical protein
LLQTEKEIASTTSAPVRSIPDIPPKTTDSDCMTKQQFQREPQIYWLQF